MGVLDLGSLQWRFVDRAGGGWVHQQPWGIWRRFEVRGTGGAGIWLCCWLQRDATSRGAMRSRLVGTNCLRCARGEAGKTRSTARGAAPGVIRGSGGGGRRRRSP